MTFQGWLVKGSKSLVPGRPSKTLTSTSSFVEDSQILTLLLCWNACATWRELQWPPTAQSEVKLIQEMKIMCLKSHRCLNILGSMSTGQTEHDGTLFTPAFSFSSDHGKVVNVSEVKRQRKKKVEVAGDGKKKKQKEKSEEKKKTTHDFFRVLIPITQHFSFWNFLIFAHLFILSSFSF